MTRQTIVNTVDRADIVMIGNGIAGQTAAIEARRLMPGRNIVMITEQSHPTINTPALKQFAIGKLTREQLLAFPAGTERTQRIHVINARVEEIHAQSKYVSLTGGRCFGYGSLLIATGSSPTGLPAGLPGRDFDGVLTLHRLNDYLDLRRRLSEVDEAVVIGGGSHAVETVMCLLYWGVEVHWLIRSDTFLPRMLDRPASDIVIERIQRAGAKVYTETEVIGIVGRVGSVAGVVTNRHQLLPCQLVLVCTGTAPVTAIARHCDQAMQYKNGILVDNQLRTSVRDIYAAGDVAALQDPQTGAYAPRAQWYAAVLQARIAAAAMAGSAHAEGFGVPWHATRLGELSMLTVGNPLQSPDVATTLTDSGKGSYRRLSIIDDRLVGYLSLGPNQPDGLAIKRLIDEGLSIRDIKKSLLKGEFDARQFFSRQRTYAAQRMINTGKLPTPAFVDTGPQQQPSLVRSVRETGPLGSPAAAGGTYTAEARTGVDTDSIIGTPLYLRPTPAYAGVRAPAEMPATSSYRDASASMSDERFLLDDYTKAPRDSTPVRGTGDIPGQEEVLFFEEGIAPHHEKGRPLNRRHIVESTLVPLPDDTPRRPSSSLWSYSSKMPAVKAKRGGSQFIAPNPLHTTRQTFARSPGEQFATPSTESEKEPERQKKLYPSSSLWSFTDKQAVVKKGR